METNTISLKILLAGLLCFCEFYGGTFSPSIQKTLLFILNHLSFICELIKINIYHKIGENSIHLYVEVLPCLPKHDYFFVYEKQ